MAPDLFMNVARPIASGTGSVIQRKSSAPNAASIQKARFFSPSSFVPRRRKKLTGASQKKPAHSQMLPKMCGSGYRPSSAQGEKKCENKAVT